LLHDAGYPDGLAVTVIATQALEVQATVVSKMLEQVGFKVELQLLDPGTFNQKTYRSHLDRPAAQQEWDIALFPGALNVENFSVFEVYHYFALDGPQDWVIEQPELRRLYAQALQTADREQQQGLIRQMERHTSEQAYFLFLYNPIKLYAVNKAVEFVPYASGVLKLDKTAVTEQHWSMRK